MSPAAVPIQPCDDPATIEAIFRRAPWVHVYGLGDLHESTWQRSTWWTDGRVAVGALTLDDDDDPVLYAQGEPGDVSVAELLVAVADQFPDRSCGSIAVGIADALAPSFDVGAPALFRRRVIETVTPHLAALAESPPRATVNHLAVADFDAVLDFLRLSGDSRALLTPDMLTSGHYLGALGDDGELIATAGVHLVEPERSVAAIGNVATHPDHRGQGLAAHLMARLTVELLDEVALVGLNHRDDNAAARRLYDSLGFATGHRFEHRCLVRRSSTVPSFLAPPGPTGASPDQVADPMRGPRPA